MTHWKCKLSRKTRFAVLISFHLLFINHCKTLCVLQKKNVINQLTLDELRKPKSYNNKDI